MSLKINDNAPDFSAETTQGKINFYDWAGDSWVVLFSHPKNFTPVCTTELGALEGIKNEFDKRGVKILGLSVDPVEDHESWSNDIKEVTGHKNAKKVRYRYRGVSKPGYARPQSFCHMHFADTFALYYR